jgi:hypothetical protein
VVVTQCSQFFHEVQIAGLKSDTTYYYKISAANGTTASDVLSFTTARAAGNPKEFTVAVLNDMGYTNAGGTHQQLMKAVDDGVAFAVTIPSLCLASLILQYWASRTVFHLPRFLILERKHMLICCSGMEVTSLTQTIGTLASSLAKMTGPSATTGLRQNSQAVAQSPLSTKFLSRKERSRTKVALKVAI